MKFMANIKKHDETCLWRGIGSIGREDWSFWRTQTCWELLRFAWCQCGWLPMGRSRNWSPGDRASGSSRMLWASTQLWAAFERRDLKWKVHMHRSVLWLLSLPIWIPNSFVFYLTVTLQIASRISRLANCRNPDSAWLLRFAWSVIFSQFLMISESCFSQLLSHCFWRIFAWLSVSTVSPGRCRNGKRRCIYWKSPCRSAARHSPA